jgi:prevent-host-death family protein
VVKLAQVKLYMSTKKEKLISVREFLRNYKDIVVQKNTVIISKNGKPEGVFIPYTEWEKLNPPKKRKKIKLSELRQFMFKDGADPDLSKNIDKILYGWEK